MNSIIDTLEKSKDALTSINRIIDALSIFDVNSKAVDGSIASKINKALIAIDDEIQRYTLNRNSEERAIDVSKWLKNAFELGCTTTQGAVKIHKYATIYHLDKCKSCTKCHFTKPVKKEFIDLSDEVNFDEN
jgi:hypothetical protein